MKLKIMIGIVTCIGLYMYAAYANIYNNRQSLPILDPTIETVITINEENKGGAGLVYAALGDSLTAGTGVNKAEETFPYFFAQHLADSNNFPVTIINLGVPGALASDVLDNQMPELRDKHTDVITLMIGANDVHNRTPLPVFKQAVEKILTELSSRDAQLHIINIPFLGDKHLMRPPYRMYIDWQTRRYNQAINEVAATKGIAVIDLYSQTKAEAWVGGEYYSTDRFHPSATGYKLWADKIYAAFNN